MWSSGDSNIASLANSSLFWGSYQGNSAGQTFANVDVTDSNGCYAPGNASITVKPQITWNGNVVNDTTQSVVIGQQIQLHGNTGGGNWSVGGTAIGGFSVAGDRSSGQVQPFSTQSTSDVLFYWVDQGNKTVTYTVSGTTATVHFNVMGPSYGGITVIPQAPTITPDASGAPYLRLGSFPSPPPGISFSASITSPSGYFGLASWVQIINSTAVTVTLPSGGFNACSQPPGLDNGYPYSYSLQTDDSPGANLQSVSYTYNSLEDAQSFSMYLMWDPNLSNSIPVPIAVVNWGWDGIASVNGASYSASGAPAHYAVTSTTSYPTWTVLDQNGTVGCCAYVNGDVTASLLQRSRIQSVKPTLEVDSPSNHGKSILKILKRKGTA